jgi:hypothetical protein
MTITAIMTARADAAAQRYEMLVDGLRAIYSRALDMANFGSAQASADAIANAYTIARRYLEAEENEIEAASDAVSEAAKTATLEALKSKTSEHLDEQIESVLSDSDEYLTQEIRIQVERDIAFLRQALQKTALNVTIAARAQRLPVRAALMQYRTGRAQELHFFFHDRSNKRWPSRKFIRAVWRKHLLSIYNETVLLTIADHGIDRAQVVHEDPNAENHGLEVAINEGSAAVSYAEIREEIFHPNANAVLALAA